ncbi:2-oxoglutarate-dependent dioxygenase AOP3-like [Panicum virgatum]|uniref:Fe2OG dioxygenase domain-containing protein n=1 Tax=Panicum virgatum TaxID=38727 RepID=A0A8T0TR15_PANVG|nr:2-oxoglutarate-dependent dioxygenase AOP3-like [Panicum virgatum]KAG2612148.1 hypothetical protein PVAP13_4KG231230 [Panicum virgatum]
MACAEARAAVTASMVAHGYVVVVHDALDAELWLALFGRALPELYALPFDTKKSSGAFSNGPHRGYDGQVPSEVLESVAILNPVEPGNVRDFTGRLWPQGNPGFCDTIVSFAKNVLELAQTVERMTLEGLGVHEESIAWQLFSQSHTARMMLYGTPPDKETSNISLGAHPDDQMTTVIAQHEVGGLEVQVDGGRWLAVPPEPGTLIVIGGDQLTLVTNGRVPACIHRVRAPSGRERFSVLLSRRRKGDPMLRAMDELVDEDHPLMYNPCSHEEYRAFRLSEEGGKLREHNPLKAFCGVEKDGSKE